jgi:hypothetical protein
MIDRILFIPIAISQYFIWKSRPCRHHNSSNRAFLRIMNQFNWLEGATRLSQLAIALITPRYDFLSQEHIFSRQAEIGRQDVTLRGQAVV